ncbi:hypothetical protein [uncultured Shewanella sp.]|uniref:hypothetical protein n=1 Tax=uncultured Shewanella sp. TaxID=173975 RepID=UPI0026226F02|nr:hypothetical protein [uncultured Shewanella sp.]
MLQACVVVPRPVSTPSPKLVSSSSARYTVCNTETQQWDLHTQELGSLQSCQYSSQLSGICMATFGLILPLGSLIVSSSIYLVGNTVHWLEYQGRCNDGIVQRGLALFDGGSEEVELNENEIDLMDQTIVIEEKTVELIE